MRSRFKAFSLAAPLLGAGICALSAWTAPSKPLERWAVILGGDTDGYLSPCGCTDPMTGGIRRRATATRELSFGDHTLILDNGSLAGGTGRQDEMKAQTMAEALNRIGAAAINFGPGDARLGPGLALSLQALSGNRLTTGSGNAGSISLPSSVTKGPFLVVAASVDSEALESALGGTGVSVDDVTSNLVETSQITAKHAILLLQGDHAEAVRLAKAFPTLALIQFRSSGDPPDHPEHVGNVILATSGERGKSIVRLIWTGSRFSGYSAVHLGPNFKDDPAVSSIYNSYLGRVDKAGLLDQLPRRSTGAFGGSAACAPCHAEASRVWRGSAHAHALSTLDKRRESRDPDCVPCHVTGITSLLGYRSQAVTPQLAFVGCESCHGPGLAHVKAPKSVRMAKVGAESCVSCHTPLNSPNFDFERYWPRIRH